MSSFLRSLVREIIYESLLLELDPKDFDSTKKVVITAGSPGSGKSTISKLILGGLGFRNRDPDDILTHFLKREKMGTDFTKYTEEEKKKKDALRYATFPVIVKSQDYDRKMGKGIIVNTTAADTKHVFDLKNKFEEAGYSVKMLFIDASLKTSLKRNAERSRKMKPKDVKDKHEALLTAIETYKEVFGKDFHYYSNDEGKDPSLKNKEIVMISKDFVNWRPARNN